MMNIPPLTDDEKARTERHWPQALRCAAAVRKKAGFEESFIDWHAGAFLGLVAALRHHVPGRDGIWDRFLYVRVRAACWDLIRRQAPRGSRKLRFERRPRFYPTSQLGAEDQNLLFLLLDSAPPVGWELESEDTVKGLARLLPAHYATTLLVLYLHAECRSELKRTAAQLNVTHTTVGYRRNQSLALLRAALAREQREGCLP